MNIRNPKRNNVGTIDCEIEHPLYGWIPFTASPDDIEGHGRELHASLTKGELGPVAAAQARPSVVPDPAIAAREQALEELKTRPPANLLQRIELLERALGIRQ